MVVVGHSPLVEDNVELCYSRKSSRARYIIHLWWWKIPLNYVDCYSCGLATKLCFLLKLPEHRRIRNHAALLNSKKNGSSTYHILLPDP